MTEITVPCGTSFIVTASFKNEVGVAVIPTTVTWTLRDGDGAIVNGREDVAVSAATSVSILLTEADNLSLATNKRVLTFTARYNSTLLPGQEMVASEQMVYYIKNR